VRPSSSYFSPPFSRYIVDAAGHTWDPSLIASYTAQRAGKERRGRGAQGTEVRNLLLHGLIFCSTPLSLFGATSLNGCPAVTSQAFLNTSPGSYTIAGVSPAWGHLWKWIVKAGAAGYPEVHVTIHGEDDQDGVIVWSGADAATKVGRCRLTLSNPL
jgi:hypothetical protein